MAETFSSLTEMINSREVEVTPGAYKRIGECTKAELLQAAEFLARKADSLKRMASQPG